MQIGILVGHLHPHSHPKPLGPSSSFATRLSIAAQKQQFRVFFFRPQDVNLATREIKGLQYDKGWTSETFAYPPVVYNRLLSRKLESHARTIAVLQHMKRSAKTKFFNEHYLDKHRVFQQLAQAREARPYLPKTETLLSISHLHRYLSTHPTIFLKPLRGSLGIGIVRIQRHPGERYTLDRTVRRQTLTHKALTWPQLSTQLTPLLRKQRYQIQQGIALIRQQGRPVDFRVVTHKVDRRQWVASSFVARVGGAGQIVSNVARGGEVTKPRTLISVADCRKLKKAAVVVSRVMAEQLPGTFAEFGIDLALDVNGRVWLLEVNAKPAKNDHTLLKQTATPPTLINLIKVMRYLAKEANS
jgi:glutathione synthase/RimK-type ligase-like ATP-grasp enzyme